MVAIEAAQVGATRLYRLLKTHEPLYFGHERMKPRGGFVPAGPESAPRLASHAGRVTPRLLRRSPDIGSSGCWRSSNEKTPGREAGGFLALAFPAFLALAFPAGNLISKD